MFLFLRWDMLVPWFWVIPPNFSISGIDHINTSLPQILHKSISGNVSRSPDQCGGHGTIKAPNPFCAAGRCANNHLQKGKEEAGQGFPLKLRCFIMQKCVSNLVIWKFYHCWDWKTIRKKEKKGHFTSKPTPKNWKKIGSCDFHWDGKVHRLRIGSGPAACVASPPAGCGPDEASRVGSSWLWMGWFLAQIAT